MADDVQLSAGTADGAVFATDDDATRHWPLSKIAFGDTTTYTRVSATDPLPVDITTATLDVMLGTDFSGVFGASSLIATDGSAALTIGTQVLGTDGTNAQIISTNSTGHVNIADGGNVITVDGTVTANPASGTIDTVTNLAQMGGVAISLNTGVRDTGTQRVTIATDDSVPVTNAGITTIAGAVSGTEMQVDVLTMPSTAVTNAGTFATQATLQANNGVDIGDVDVTSISAGTNLIGDVGISGARTSGGTTLYRNIDVDESEDQIKATAGQVYWVHAMNLSATVKYLKFYNATAATVVVGTTVPDLTFPIPTQGDTNGAGFALAIPNGIAFGTAITIAATTGIADADSGAPGANEVVVNLGYA